MEEEDPKLKEARLAPQRARRYVNLFRVTEMRMNYFKLQPHNTIVSNIFLMFAAVLFFSIILVGPSVK
jgi:hypothetical protein